MLIFCTLPVSGLMLVAKRKCDTEKTQPKTKVVGKIIGGPVTAWINWSSGTLVVSVISLDKVFRMDLFMWR